MNLRKNLNFRINIIVCVCFTVIALTKSQDTPLVATEYGPVLGSVGFSVSGRPFNSFRGIPYAAPPIGDLRFRVRILNFFRINLY